jgi:hypothetical protein
MCKESINIKRILWFLSPAIRYLNLFLPIPMVSLKSPYFLDMPLGGQNSPHLQGLALNPLKSSLIKTIGSTCQK